MKTTHDSEQALPAMPVDMTPQETAPSAKKLLGRALNATARFGLVLALYILCLCLDINDPEAAASLRRELD